MAGILDGIRVLDFGRYIAGPFCATLLGDLGAEVIRVERVAGSEDRFLVPLTEAGDGALLMQLARNKLGLTLDPMKPEGREVVRRLVATADVVVANLPDESLEAMALDYQSLKAVKADIILTTVSAFGSGGPYGHRVGFDTVAQAMSGNMHLTGHPDEPMKAFVPYVDFSTACLSAFATMAALLERARSGRGQRVQASLLGSALTISNYWLIEQALTGVDRTAIGNRSPSAAPADAFRTRDGWIVVHAVGPVQFKRWARLMGEDHWLDDPRFKDDVSRGNHGEILSERTAAWCAERTTEEALAALDRARIPAGPILSPAEALQNPHVIAKEFLKQVDYPGLPRPAPVADSPVSFSESEAGIRRRAPTLGEHTDEILAGLGYTAAEIAALREKGVV